MVVQVLPGETTSLEASLSRERCKGSGRDSLTQLAACCGLQPVDSRMQSAAIHLQSVVTNLVNGVCSYGILSSLCLSIQTPHKLRIWTVGFTHIRRYLTKEEVCGFVVPPHIHMAIDLCFEFWCLCCSCSKTKCVCLRDVKTAISALLGTSFEFGFQSHA